MEASDICKLVDPAAAKAQLRAEIRSRRAQRTHHDAPAKDQEDRAIQRALLTYLDQHISPCRSSATFSGNVNSSSLTTQPLIAAYVPTPNEPGGCDLPYVLHRAGYKVALPRVSGTQLEWVIFIKELVNGPFGLREPVGPAVQFTASKTPEVFIIPALAVDNRGYRLGQGGGFYDREFANKYLNSEKLAIVNHTEHCAHVPHEQHDLQVNTIITGQGVTTISTTNAHNQL